MCVMVRNIIMFAFEFINYNTWEWMPENIVLFSSTVKDFTKLRVTIYIVYD